MRRLHAPFEPKRRCVQAEESCCALTLAVEREHAGLGQCQNPAPTFHRVFAATGSALHGSKPSRPLRTWLLSRQAAPTEHAYLREHRGGDQHP